MRAALFILFFIPLAAFTQIRVGYYGGTFDPPTRGHRGLIERAIKAANLDLVYMFPSMTNAKKPNASPYLIRRQMVEAMIADMPNVRGPDAELEEEFQRGRLAAEIETIMRRHNGAKVFIVTGDDVISRNYSRFISENPAFRDVGIIIGQRKSDAAPSREDLRDFDFADREVIVFSPAADEGISSSLVKSKFKFGHPVEGNFLDQGVIDVIHQHGLYPPICPRLFTP